MRLNWNSELKKLVFGMFIFITLGMTIGNSCLILCQNRIRQEYTMLAGSVFEKVQEQYPQVTAEDLVLLFANDEPSESGLSIVAQYGVFDEFGSKTFGRQEKYLGNLSVVMNIFFVTFVSFGVFIIMFYLRKRQGKIAKLQMYMENLDRGIYNLEPEDNADDELSGLRNEIYRLTVLLREQAISAQSQRKALADSVADISHQLKTPLTSLTVIADNLAENEDMDNTTRQNFLSEIIRQLSGMSWLVATMLKLSRLEAGVVDMQPQRVLISELVENCVRKLDTLAELKEIKLIINLQKDACLNVDVNWTVEAVCNIVKNAIEHSPQGGMVTISAADNDIYTEICISDSGTGISEHEREKLFQRFYRGHAADDDSAGIGLSLSKEVIERQNGHIYVESEVGKNTVFRLRFLK